MKRFLSFIAAVVLVLGILYIAKADINHGHGPDANGAATESADNAQH